MSKKFSIKEGFTLIELLVVIAIIGILSSFLVSNFIGVRQRGRDGTRKSDLRQVQAALELYRSDQGTYPASLPACGSSLTGGTSTYMQKTPCDPLNTTTQYSYCTANSNNNYAIRACLENANDSQIDAAGATFACAPTACGSGYYGYTLQNP